MSKLNFYYVFAILMVLCVTVGVLGIWEAIEGDFAWKAFGTLLLIGGGLFGVSKLKSVMNLFKK